MDLVVISDVHGDTENLLKFLEKLENFKFDVIVCPGDFTDSINLPKGFSQADVARLIIKELKTLKKELLTIPGNTDTPNVLKVLEDEGVSIHGKGKVMGDVGFYGFGGARTPFGTPFEPSDEELKGGLGEGWKEIEKAKYKVQVTHNPPVGVKLDMISSGAHVGSKVVSDFIKSHHPILSISAHIHEAKGTDRLNDTFLINAGRFPEGYFGLVNIENGSVKGKVLNLIE